MTTQCKLSIAAAAMAGLLAGASSRAMATPVVSVPASGSSMTTSLRGASSAPVNFGARVVTDATKDVHDCAGKNSCKGNGGCKTGDQGCKGKNTCKGKGGCSTKGTSKLAATPEMANLGALLARTADATKDIHDCAGKNSCKGNGGCKTGDQGCKGKNTCKGKGGCSTKGTSKLAATAEMANLGTLLARTADATKDIHDCAGKNSCKGNGGCKTGDQGCKGKNTCKGKGGCSTKGTSKI